MVVLGAVVALSGCLHKSREARIAGRFSASTGCPFEQIHVERDGDVVVAWGCDKSLRYECYDASCPSMENVKAAAPEEPRGERRRVTVLQLVVVLEGAGGLLFTASPQEREEAEMALDAYAHRDCDLDMMVDGQLLELAKGPSKPSLVLPRDVVLALASAQQVGVRACEKRWSLPASDLKQLHRFGRRYAEELAWQGTSSNGASAGRRPPIGGWQPWRGLESFPAPLPAEAALAGTQLFEKLAPSVWRVETRRDGGVAQGSAVAVSKNRLLTNCHVLEGALKIVVKQGKTEFVAKLEDSDPVKDRCVLGVADAPFKPVAGVRPYADLKVGEPLFTLGAPSGLDLTMADGMLSGRREEEGVRYVQTTAPISPGSSGGGLFDARGNLVGITTLSFVGKERLNQSLNFAIAAEMYWSP